MMQESQFSSIFIKMWLVNVQLPGRGNLRLFTVPGKNPLPLGSVLSAHFTVRCLRPLAENTAP